MLFFMISWLSCCFESWFCVRCCFGLIQSVHSCSIWSWASILQILCRIHLCCGKLFCFCMIWVFLCDSISANCFDSWVFWFYESNCVLSSHVSPKLSSTQCSVVFFIILVAWFALSPILIWICLILWCFFLLDLSSYLCVRSIQILIHQFHCVLEVLQTVFNSRIRITLFLILCWLILLIKLKSIEEKLWNSVFIHIDVLEKTRKKE